MSPILAKQGDKIELKPPLLHSYVEEGVSILWLYLHLVMQELIAGGRGAGGRDHFSKDVVVFIDHFQKDDV